MHRFLLFCLLMVAGPGVAAQAVTGTWTGFLQGNLRLIFHFTGGAAPGFLDVPQQGAVGLPFQSVTLNKDSLVCRLSVPAARYVAARINDSTLSGNWFQGQGVLPLELHRSPERETEAYAPPGRPQTPHPPYPYHSDSVEYDNAERTVHLGATLTRPSTGGPFPAVILITGSGIQDRDESMLGHKPFAVIADYLTRRGYAVLRVDDRTAGLSTGDVIKATSADFAKDVETSLAYLKTRKEVNPKKIGLIGHSEGGMIAPMVAARNKDVAFIILLAAPVNGYATLLYQVLGPLQKANASGPYIAYSLFMEKTLLDNSKTAPDSAAFARNVAEAYGKYVSNIPDSIKPLYSFVLPPDRFMHNIAGSVHTFVSPWYKFFLTYEPAANLAHTRCPVLALGGDKDIQVDNTVDLDVLRDLILEGGNKRVTIRLLPGLNHLFQHCRLCQVPEYGRLEETMAPEVLQAMGDWLDKIAKP